MNAMMSCRAEQWFRPAVFAGCLFAMAGLFCVLPFSTHGEDAPEEARPIVQAGETSGPPAKPATDVTLLDSGTPASLQWHAEPGKKYRLFYKKFSPGAGWVDLETELQFSEKEAVFSFVTEKEKGFYRLVEVSDGQKATVVKAQKSKCDFNGDGASDLAALMRGDPGGIHVAISTGTGFIENAAWQDSSYASSAIPLAGDFNGDGKADIASVCRNDTGEVYVSLSTGSSFVPKAQWQKRFCNTNEIPVAGDFDGDGRDDLAVFARGGGDPASTAGDVRVMLSNGNAFGPIQKWHEFFCAWNEIPVAGDFNGDGKTDIATLTRGGKGIVYVALSTGNSFGPGKKWCDSFCRNNELPAVGDVDGDGKDDLLSFARGSGEASTVAGDVRVALSTGHSFSASRKWHEFFCAWDEIPGTGDFDGDGKTDLVTFTRTGMVWVSSSTGNGFATSRKSLDTFCAAPKVPLPGLDWDAVVGAPPPAEEAQASKNPSP